MRRSCRCRYTRCCPVLRASQILPRPLPRGTGDENGTISNLASVLLPHGAFRGLQGTLGNRCSLKLRGDPAGVRASMFRWFFFVGRPEGP